jgi:hypothetical protein
LVDEAPLRLHGGHGLVQQARLAALNQDLVLGLGDGALGSLEGGIAGARLRLDGGDLRSDLLRRRGGCGPGDLLYR